MKEKGQGLTEMILILVLVALVVICFLEVVKPVIIGIAFELSSNNNTYSAEYSTTDSELDLTQTIYVSNQKLGESGECPDSLTVNNVIYTLVDGSCLVKE